MTSFTYDLTALSLYCDRMYSDPMLNTDVISKFEKMPFHDQCAIASAWLYGYHYQSDHHRAKDDNELYGNNT